MQDEPFPIKALPGCLGEYVRQSAESIQCPESFIALPLLACLGRAIGNKRTAWVRDKWHPPAIIWGAIIGPSGVAKSPALNSATQFLYDIGAEREESYTTTDATYAGLRRRLSEPADTSLLLVKDELIGFLSSIGKGGQSSLSRSDWLERFDARPLEVDRHKDQIRVARGSVSVIGGIQPEIFAGAMQKEGLSDGLCARFLLTYQETEKAKRWTDHSVDQRLNNAVLKIFRRLVTLQADEPNGKVEPRSIPFTPLAMKEFKRYFNRHHAQQRKLEDDLKPAWEKLLGYVPRIALILQLATWASKPKGKSNEGAISTLTLRKAIALVDWFKAEAMSVYAMFGETKKDVERRKLVTLIREFGGQIRARELQQQCRRYKTSPDASLALGELVKEGEGKWEPVPPGKKGGRFTRVFVLGE